MRGAGYDKVDLRIHAIDALSRDSGLSPDGVETDDATEPPLPAMRRQMERGQGRRRRRYSDTHQCARSPAVSELAALPIKRGGAGAKFGLDLNRSSRASRAPTSRRLSRRHASRSPAASAAGCACRSPI